MDWIDAAKGVGIVLVVLGHAIGGLNGIGLSAEDGPYRALVRWMYAFHMPLFFFLAGLLVRDSATRRFAPYLRSKVGVVVYPYLLWSLLTGLMQHVFAPYSNHSVSILRLVEIVYAPIDQYWFLYTIFVMYMLFWVWVRVEPAALLLCVMSALLYAGGAAAPGTAAWVVAGSVCAFLCYFAAGAFLVRTAALRRLAGLATARLLGVGVVGYALVALRTFLGGQWDAALHPAVAAGGIASTLAWAMLASRWRLRVLPLLGAYSLEIYVAHTMFSAGIRALLLRLGLTAPLVHVVAGTTIGLGGPLALAVICARVRFPFMFTLRGRVRSGQIGTAAGASAMPLPSSLSEV